MLEPGALAAADDDDARYLSSSPEDGQVSTARRTSVQPTQRGVSPPGVDASKMLEFAQSSASKKLVAAQLEQRRESWRKRSVRLEEQFRSVSHYHAGLTNLEENAARDAAEEAFKNFVIDTLVGRMVALRQAGKPIDASATVVALCEYLNEVFFGVVRGKDTRLKRLFNHFKPHSPVCTCYFVLDASMAVMEEFLEDEDLCELLEKSEMSGKSSLHKQRTAALKKTLSAQLRVKLDNFMRDSEYDPFGHICVEEASLEELRQDQAQGELEPLFQVMA
ncbi:Hypothetical Protein FCC1311_080602 [Hondaea fermentalgiana]|uniref:Uncharacterized protein n=1 Tax=Hondaea fermentalgiana TaxID=2315210 RepID=A0A2R5GMH7_9STRA|nr:Hypothetical Protein FCC1311_080602 [Hondaea fermentalgiana]|eukprot:GBG31835.1 Hypothetical Protein FCC1311_080602 [Hondaea fermentalgiana]